MLSPLKSAARAVTAAGRRAGPLSVRGALREQTRELAELRGEVRRLNGRMPRGKSEKRIKVNDADLTSALRTVEAEDRTLLGQDRLWILWQAALNTASLGLPAAEVGAYRGGSSYFLATAFRKALGHDIPIHVVDTFEGHPEGQLSDADDPRHVAGLFASKVSYEDVVEYLSPFEQVTVHKGAFATVVDRLPQGAYGFAHIDVDVYRPMLECLRFFGPRLVPGGVMVLDDYEARKCPGVARAAEEFLAEYDGFLRWHPLTEQLVLVRARG